jgi:hypothetical protein
VCGGTSIFRQKNLAAGGIHFRRGGSIKKGSQKITDFLGIGATHQLQPKVCPPVYGQYAHPATITAQHPEQILLCSGSFPVRPK